MLPKELSPSLSTACLLPHRLSKIFDLAAGAGFGGIELVLGPEAWFLGPARLGRLAASRGLVIYSVHQALFRYSPSGLVGGRMLAAARTALELGCPRAVIHGPWTDDWSSPEGQRWLSDLGRCQKVLSGTGARLSLENPGVYSDGDRRNVLASFSVLLDFAERHDLDLTLDTCHVGTDSPDLLEASRVIHPRLTNVHLSDLQDARFRDRPLLRSIYAHHQLPGEGRLPLGALLSNLILSGYRGPITLEASPFALRSGSPSAAARRLTQAMMYIESSVSAPAPTTPPALPRCPLPKGTI